MTYKCNESALGQLPTAECCRAAALCARRNFVVAAISASTIDRGHGSGVGLPMRVVGH